MHNIQTVGRLENVVYKNAQGVTNNGSVEVVYDPVSGQYFVREFSVQELINIARREFDAYSNDWLKINPHTGKEMFNAETGGYVVYHRQHNVTVGNLDSQSEFAIAEAFALNGKKVKLLSESAPVGVATPDAEIIGMGIFDFKNVNSNSSSAISTNVRNYVMNPLQRSYAQGVVFNVKNNPNATPAAINQGVINAISSIANENNLATRIGVFYSDGSIKIINIEEFKNINGARF